MEKSSRSIKIEKPLKSSEVLFRRIDQKLNWFIFLAAILMITNAIIYKDFGKLKINSGVAFESCNLLQVNGGSIGNRYELQPHEFWLYFYCGFINSLVSSIARTCTM
ncbi:TPA: hypothetical protein J8J82_001172 [Legionella pneumophila]|nr:hypothetical protein [Legionella pneumophila]HBA1636104.1 hypothetical protein [Legionella pneumophila]